jgi:hypothetical protein
MQIDIHRFFGWKGFSGSQKLTGQQLAHVCISNLYNERKKLLTVIVYQNKEDSVVHVQIHEDKAKVLWLHLLN